jgi:thiol-disulfide isomerase/thioredoxin
MRELGHTQNAVVRTSRRLLATWAAIVVAISVVIGVLVSYPQRGALAPSADLPQTILELQFQDASGKVHTLADFRGRVVLLNIWATWCGPCRKEMPALDRLQAKLGGPGFQVLALSIDRSPDRIQPFFDEIGIKNLSIYTDRSSAAMATLDVVGVPTTLLIDREGREIRRWVGPAEWDSPEIEAVMGRQLDPAELS